VARLRQGERPSRKRHPDHTWPPFPVTGDASNNRFVAEGSNDGERTHVPSGDRRRRRVARARHARRFARQLRALGSVLASVPDGIFRLDAQLRHTFVNDTIVRLSGLSADRFVGRTGRELGIDACFVLEASCREVLATGRPGFLEWSAGGHHYRSRLVPELGADGAVLGIVGVIEDVTEQRLASEAHQRVEDALRESELRHRRLVDDVRDHAIIGLDVEGRIATWSAGAASIFGYTEAEAIGKPLASLATPEAQADGAPERELATARMTGRSEEDGWHVRKGGERFWASGVVTALRSNGGELRGYAKLTRDETEQRRARAALEASEERLRLAMQAAAMGHWDWDLASGLVLWSPEHNRILGLPPSETRGTYESLIERVHPDDRRAVAAALARTARDHVTFSVEFRAVWPDGTTHWIAADARTYDGDDGRPTRIVGVVRDVTDRKHAETERERLGESERAARAEAERANRLKDELLARVSHELRTPIAAITLWTHVLRTADPATRERAFEAIAQSGRAHTKLVDDLLDTARALTGKLQVDRARLDLARVVGLTLEGLRPRADERSVRLSYELPDHPAWVDGDAARLQQATTNLVENAIKFSARGGRVAIGVACEGKDVELTVRDEGRGIAPSFLPHIFEPFRQADGSSTREHGGLGLGLAIVRQLIELHGGKVAAASEGEGRGATFTITLPAAAPGGDDESARPSAVPPHLVAGVRVLLVEDNDLTRAGVALVLENAGARVVSASSAPAAFAALRAGPPDVILCDISMPGEDGYAFMRRVRALPPAQGGRVPAAAFTAHASDEDRAHAEEGGFQAYVTKPVAADAIVEVIARLARRPAT